MRVPTVMPCLWFLLAVTASVCAGPKAAEYAGTWVFSYQSQPVLKLDLTVEGNRIEGAVTRPKDLTIDQDGDVTAIGPAQVVLPVQKAYVRKSRLELTIDGDRFLMTLEGSGAASLAVAGMRPWKLERAPDPNAVVLATSLIELDYPEAIRALRERLRAMVAEDQAARMAFDAARMDEVDNKYRAEVMGIFDHHGWVTKSLAGKEAAHNFWLLVQHQAPDVQRQLLPALEKAAKAGEASMSDYVYLYDRVQIGLGKPQHWGTNTKCENRKPVLFPVDDPAGLDARRRELYLLPVRDYLKMDYLVRYCRETK